MLIWDGILITLHLFWICSLLSIVTGTLFGIIGASRQRWLRVIAEFYVEFNRNVPLVVQFFFLYFAVGFDSFTAAVVGLTIHQSAYMAEIIRSGIQSLPRGQFEAGFSTGLGRPLIYRFIILPQAFTIIIPPLTTQLLEVLKNSSIAMTITVAELTFQTQQIESFSFRGFEAATAATIIYLIMGLVIASGMNSLEYRINRQRHTALKA